MKLYNYYMEAVYVGMLITIGIVGIKFNIELYIILLLAIMIIGMKIEYNQWSVRYGTHH